MTERETVGMSAYLVVDVKHEIIFYTFNYIEAMERYTQLKDKSGSSHIVLSKVKTEFITEDGLEYENTFQPW